MRDVAAVTQRSSPRVSVVIPAHNRATTVVAAVDSVLRQTYSNVEVIVVDDASSDRTAEIAMSIAARDARVRVERHGTNRGAQAARNTGIVASTGEWVSFLDSDDTYFPESVEHRLRLALASNSPVVHSDCDTIDASGAVAHFGVRPLAGRVHADLLKSPGPVFCAMLVRRELLFRIGLLDERIKAYQEWDTAIMLSRIAPFAFLAESTFLYDLRTPVAISRSVRREALGFEQVVQKHRRDIIRHHGPQVLSHHFHYVARRLASIGDRRGAAGRLAVAIAIWPVGLRNARYSAGALIRGAADPRVGA